MRYTDLRVGLEVWFLCPTCHALPRLGKVVAVRKQWGLDCAVVSFSQPRIAPPRLAGNEECECGAWSAKHFYWPESKSLLVVTRATAIERWLYESSCGTWDVADLNDARRELRSELLALRGGLVGAPAGP
jgi:hypothetical protein